MGRGDYRRDKERTSSELPRRRSQPSGSRSPLWRRVQPGADRRRRGAPGQMQEAAGRRQSRMDDEPPVCREGWRRRTGSAPAGGRRSEEFLSRSGRGGKEGSGKEGQQESQEEGRGAQEEEKQVSASDRPWEPRPGGDSRQQWLGPFSPEAEAVPQEGQAYGEKGQEKEAQLLQRRELREKFEQFSREQRCSRRHIWPKSHGKAHLAPLPRRVNSDIVGHDAGATVDCPGAALGPGPARAAAPVPAVLPGQHGSQNAACNAARGAPPSVLPGPGYSRQDSGDAGCLDPEVEGFGRANQWQALDSDQSIRTGARGACSRGNGPGDRGCGKRSTRSRTSESSGSPALRHREQPGSQPGMEERRGKRQRSERPRQGQRLEAGQQGSEGLQAGEGERAGQRQGKREVEGKEGASAALDVTQGGQEPPGGFTGGEGFSPGGGEDPLKVEVGGEKVARQEASPSFTSTMAGPEGKKAGPSQEYSPGPSFSSRRFLSSECGALEGRELVAMGDLLNDALGEYGDVLTSHSRPQPSGLGSMCIFPLPLSSEIIKRSPHPGMVRATCRALNLLYGESQESEKRKLSGAGERALRFVCRCVEDMGNWTEKFPKINFDIFFRSKGVDYRGEEVRVAQRFSWTSISPAMPPEVGGVELLDFCTLGTKFYIQNFPDFLVPADKQFLGRAPTVMVGDDDWLEVCRGLLDRRVCGIIPLNQVFHIHGRPLLGGLFGVGKNEFVGNVETQRLIMNFVPLNDNCRPVDSDISTLPGISGLSPFILEDGEIALISSEDIRCFFYLFSLPANWFPFLAFNKLLPPELVPNEWKGQPCVLHARVLPIGFRNSVGIAQHIHRNVIRHALANALPPISGEGEMRKDRAATSCKASYRIYLDNFDAICKVDPDTAAQIEGKPGLLSLLAREAYSEAKLTRHPGKSVCQAEVAEVQGALVDGRRGIAYPKPAKVGIYVSLGLELLRRGVATQKEMQVVCGGFVYVCLFRRPLLSALNACWRFIEAFKHEPPVVRLPLPREVRLEIARFCALVPLARMDFRLTCMGDVTASDASSSGGGACVSSKLTSYGAAAANAAVRGDIPEEHDLTQVLSVGLFDGVGCLRIACDLLGLPMAGHISVEKAAEGRRVVEAAFADTIFVPDVEMVDEELVASWAGRFTQVGLVLIGAGPPCQGVSGLNSDRRGALRDVRSSLFQHVPRIKLLFKRSFPWAQVHLLMESVASMDEQDKEIMSRAVDEIPFHIDAAGITLAHRPRLYWCDWELLAMVGVDLTIREHAAFGQHHTVTLTARLDPMDYLEPGWKLQHENQRLPTFTTSRPSPQPGRKPAGLKSCKPHERHRWEEDMHRFPPYQYRDNNCLVHRDGSLRIATIKEMEVIMGMPLDYTASCSPKSQRGTASYTDTRLSLVGNAWCIPVITYLVYCLCRPLGLCRSFSLQQMVWASKPGGAGELQRLLLRPPLRRSLVPAPVEGVQLVKKLAGLVSIKGEDLLLQSSSEHSVKHQRLRASVPANLWQWRTIAGWAWQGSPEHINVLELRAIYTTVRWWVSQRKAHSCRFVHLTDSLVCLHALSRGRSSSRKMRRTIAKLNSYLLACNLHPLWAYVHTSANPADRPSRRKVRKKWAK